LLALGREFARIDGGATGVAGFVAWLDTAARTEPDDGVALATFHRAKGLEWPLVFVTGLEDRLVPIGWAATHDQVAEERRLLHVAISRAGDDVHCSWSRTRAVGTRTVAREPSPWLPELERAARPFRVANVDITAHVAEMRTALAAATPPTPVERPARRRTH
jgi:DNA helicase-2/ATP-dependent DNA helicase PcrA